MKYFILFILGNLFTAYVFVIDDIKEKKDHEEYIKKNSSNNYSDYILNTNDLRA